MSFVDWQAGMQITASRLRDITPELTKWSPTWTTSTGANSLSFGNATVVAEYMEFGQLCIGRLEITFGTTANFGGGLFFGSDVSAGTRNQSSAARASRILRRE